MERRDLICIGTSAGGVEALKKIASALPENLPAAVVVVLHLAPDHRSGTTVVQDPEDAFCPDMPRSALDYVKPDHIAKLAEIGPLLGRLAGGRVEGSRESSPLLKDEAEIETLSPLHGHETVGMPSPFSCPACG